MKVRIWTLTVDDDGDKVNGPINTHVFASEDKCWASLRNNYDAEGQVPAGDNDALMKHVMTQGVAFYIDDAEVDVPTPFVEILHIRHPDADCEHAVLVGAERVREFTVEDVDPGKGYLLSDWDEHTEFVRANEQLSAEFRAMVCAERDEARDNRYIEDDSRGV